MAKSKLTRSQSQLQYDRAKRLGWIPFFFEAAKTHTHDLFDAADLMAIGSRETNLDPKWLTKAGDGGHGHGLMQIDDRSFPEFTKSEYWKDARLGILYGAKVLRQKWDDTQSSIGKRRIIKGNAFIGKDVGQGYEAQQVAIAAYNCGRWAHYNVSKGKDVDRTTTGRDYSSDVLGRSAQFRELLTADGWFIPRTDEPNTSVLDDSTDNQPLKTEVSVQTTDGDTTVTTTETSAPVVSISAPPPYRGVGFWASIKKDLAAAFGGNLTFGTLNEYAQQASGWPEWIIGIIKIVAVGVLIATFGYFLFRVLHYTVDRLQYWFAAKTEAQINANPAMANVQFVEHTEGETK